MPWRPARKKKEPSENAIQELAGVWRDATGLTYEVHDDWSITRCEGSKVRKIQLAVDSDQTGCWFLWGTTHYLNLVDIKGSRAAWYPIRDLKKRSQAWIWHRLVPSASEWPTSDSVIRKLAGVWSGTRGETYEVFASDWSVVREGGNRKTSRYELSWGCDDVSCWISWGSSYYLDALDFRDSPEAVWYRSKDLQKGSPAWTWRRVSLKDLGSSPDPYMSKASPEGEKPGGGSEVRAPVASSNGVISDSDSESWASAGAWEMNRNVLRICYSAWVAIPACTRNSEETLTLGEKTHRDSCDTWAGSRVWRKSRETESKCFGAWAAIAFSTSIAFHDLVQKEKAAVAQMGVHRLRRCFARWLLCHQHFRTNSLHWIGLSEQVLHMKQGKTLETALSGPSGTPSFSSTSSKVIAGICTDDDSVDAVVMSCHLRGASLTGDESTMCNSTAEGSDAASTCVGAGSEWSCSASSVSVGALRTLQAPMAAPHALETMQTRLQALLAAPLALQMPPVPQVLQTFSCALEQSIADMIAQMHTSLISRHPARAKLFQTVQSAVIDALGRDFKRLALVGSAALGIDTPASDIDAVAFTQGVTIPTHALRRIAAVLKQRDPVLRLDLIDPPGAPALLVIWSADGTLSMDLTVNQPLAERHVLWLSLQGEFASPRFRCAAIPEIFAEARFAATVIRCVKWWLRRRQLPTTKEGGYPTIVWTLMALHSLRCFVAERKEHGVVDNHNRRLLGALYAFFDRFVSHRCRSGSIFFAGDGSSEFCPHAPSQDGPGGCSERNLPGLWPSLSVGDPSTTAHSSDIEKNGGTELVPRISSATQLLYASELCRAQRLSAIALNSLHNGHCSDLSGTVALQDLLAESFPSAGNTLPTDVSACKNMAAVFIRKGLLELGIIHKIFPRPGWTAAFLHRRDAQSTLLVCLRSVDVQTGVLSYACLKDTEVQFSPCDFVRLVPLSLCHGGGYGSLSQDELQQWCEMRGILTEATGATDNFRSGRSYAFRPRAKGNQACMVAKAQVP